MYSVRTFSASIPIPLFLKSYVHVASFEALCQQCPHYAKTWSCPPYTFDPLDIWSQYDVLEITAVQLSFEPFCSTLTDEDIQRQMMHAFSHEKNLLNASLMQREQNLMGSRALFAGHCNACEGNCTRMNDEPCIHPEKMRYSIESLGGDVIRLLHELLGITLEWSADTHVSQYMVAVGGLLRVDSAK